MNQDNLEVAVNMALDETKLTIHQSTGAGPGEGTVQVLIRATATSRDRWKETAGRLGISLAEMVRRLCDAQAAELLDCTHPREVWRHNRYGASCGKCGQQLSARR